MSEMTYYEALSGRRDDFTRDRKILAIAPSPVLERLVEAYGEGTVVMAEQEAKDYSRLKATAELNDISGLLVAETVQEEIRKNVEDLAQELRLHYAFFSLIETYK